MARGRFCFIGTAHLFLIRERQVLLLRRYNTGYADGQYSVVAGHLDGGESVKGAAIREAREEVGIEIAPEDLSIVGVMHRRVAGTDEERLDFFLAATRWSGEIANCEPHKCDDLAWFDRDRLPGNIVPYVRRALGHSRQQMWFDSVIEAGADLSAWE